MSNKKQWQDQEVSVYNIGDFIMQWGFLREHSSMAEGVDPETGLCRTGFDEYLKVIFPDVDDWIHDKTISSLPAGVKLRTRPDYRSEKLKMIVEFDGLQHYSNPNKIEIDKKNTENYINLGYKVVRIPYFIQLTNNVVEQLFDKKINSNLFSESIPSMGLSLGNTPAFLCIAGIVRMAIEFQNFPEQYDTNMRRLEEINDETKTAANLLSQVYKLAKKMNINDFKDYNLLLTQMHKHFTITG